jgi:hypothetical protein
MDDDLSRFWQKPAFPDHGQWAHGNLTACARYGKYRRLLYCRACKARLSERRARPCSTPTCPRSGRRWPGPPRRRRRRPPGRRGRKPRPVKVPLRGLTYATVHKTRKKNRVVKVEARVVYGTKTAVKL